MSLLFMSFACIDEDAVEIVPFDSTITEEPFEFELIN